MFEIAALTIRGVPATYWRGGSPQGGSPLRLGDAFSPSLLSASGATERVAGHALPVAVLHCPDVSSSVGSKPHAPWEVFVTREDPSSQSSSSSPSSMSTNNSTTLLVPHRYISRPHLRITVSHQRPLSVARATTNNSHLATPTTTATPTTATPFVQITQMGKNPTLFRSETDSPLSLKLSGAGRNTCAIQLEQLASQLRARRPTMFTSSKVAAEETEELLFFLGELSFPPEFANELPTFVIFARLRWNPITCPRGDGRDGMHYLDPSPLIPTVIASTSSTAAGSSQGVGVASRAQHHDGSPSRFLDRRDSTHDDFIVGSDGRALPFSGRLKVEPDEGSSPATRGIVTNAKDSPLSRLQLSLAAAAGGGGDEVSDEDETPPRAIAALGSANPRLLPSAYDDAPSALELFQRTVPPMKPKRTPANKARDAQAVGEVGGGNAPKAPTTGSTSGRESHKDVRPKIVTEAPPMAGGGWTLPVSSGAAKATAASSALLATLQLDPSDDDDSDRIEGHFYRAPIPVPPPAPVSLPHPSARPPPTAHESTASAAEESRPSAVASKQLLQERRGEASEASRGVHDARPTLAAAPAIWEWKTHVNAPDSDPRAWATYDAASSASLEAAYRKKEPFTFLNPTYGVVFDDADVGCVQYRRDDPARFRAVRRRGGEPVDRSGLRSLRIIYPKRERDDDAGGGGGRRRRRRDSSEESSGPDAYEKDGWLVSDDDDDDSDSDYSESLVSDSEEDDSTSEDERRRRRRRREAKKKKKKKQK